MAIELIDVKGNVINQASGIDFGSARAGFPSSKYFKVYNDSDKIAYNVTLSVDGTTEAVDWKAFKLYDDSLPTKQLVLGDLFPNSYFEGQEAKKIEFVKGDSMFREVWNTGIIEYHTSSIKFVKNTGDGSGISGARIALDGLGLLKTLDVSFKTKMEVDLSYENYDTTIINFPIRMNSNKDLKGYCISFRRRRSDNKFYASVYKNGKGMVDNQDRDYGTNFYNSGWIDAYDEDMTIRFKVWNNLNNQPCFEIYLNDKPLTLKKSSNTSISTTTVIDDEEITYINAGGFFIDYSIWNGDISLEILDLVVKHEIPEHLITYQTTISFDTEDKSIHKSELIVEYEEDVEEG